ncbi:MAG: ATP-binding protein [Ignavibacteriaceae bacterium]|nr:ATP-binding protein [Ignavibacteriaceae bacterium]
MANFRPRARLLLQLGDQLIKNESIAILELVKNCYDAGASYAKIEMEKLNQGDGIIVVEDDGCGMDLEIIKSVWLEPGSDYKVKLKKELKENDLRRVPLGEKGIGRFSVHKLGESIQLISKMKGKNEIEVNIDWTFFNSKKYDYIDQVPIEIKEREPIYFKGNKTGTYIKISNLRTVQWSETVLKDIYRSVNAFTTPFKTLDSFKVDFKIDDDDILEKIPTVDEIKNLALYRFYCEIEGSEITSFYYSFNPYPLMDKLRPRKLIYNYKGYKNNFIGIESIKELVKKPTRNPKKNKKESIPIDLNAKGQKIGPVKFEGWIFDRQSKILKLAETDTRALRNYLDQNGGVRVYKDGIRVYDYGEPENDWLGLEKQRLYDPGVKINKGLILAAVLIDGKKCTSLEEKTNREGFVDNEAYRTFRDAIGYLMFTIETYRNEDKDNVRYQYGLSAKTEPVMASIDDLKDYLESKIKDEQIKKTCLYKLDKIENDYKSLNEILLTSAEAGLNYSVALHEIEKITKEIKIVIKQEKTSQRIVKLIEHLAELIEMYAMIIKKSKKKVEGLKELITNALFYVQYRLKAHEITIVENYLLFKADDQLLCNRRLIISSLLNIIDNSIYWLERAQQQNKKIFISIASLSKEHIELTIADNGKGFALPAEQMIKPFISLKPGGMGLGLHIVNEIVTAQGGHLVFNNTISKELPKEFTKGAVVKLIMKRNL